MSKNKNLTVGTQVVCVSTKRDYHLTSGKIEAIYGDFAVVGKYLVDLCECVPHQDYIKRAEKIKLKWQVWFDLSILIFLGTLFILSMEDALKYRELQYIFLLTFFNLCACLLVGAHPKMIQYVD